MNNTMYNYVIMVKDYIMKHNDDINLWNEEELEAECNKLIKNCIQKYNMQKDDDFLIACYGVLNTGVFVENWQSPASFRMPSTADVLKNIKQGSSEYLDPVWEEYELFED